MPEDNNKPNLFDRLFRKAKEYKDNQSRPENKPATPIKPLNQASNKPIGNESERKIKLPLTGGKIDTYRQCPKKFQYAYLEKRGGQKAVSPHLSFDTSLHTALKLFFKNRKKGEQPRLENLLGALDLAWDNRGYVNADEEREWKVTAENALRRFFNSIENIFPNVHEVDFFFKVDLFGCEYSGKFDRVDLLPNGAYEIIDYKTGQPPAGGLAELEESDTVNLLFHVADIVWPPHKVQRITHLFLRDGTTISLERNVERMEHAKRAYLEVGEGIYQGKFEPVRSALCSWCDFQQQCPMGRIPALTPSKLRTYLECPYKYMLLYITKTVNSRAGPTKTPQTPSPELALDRALHEALAFLYREFPPNSSAPSIAIESGDPHISNAVLSAFYKALPEVFQADVSATLKEAGRAMLMRHIAEEYGTAKPKLINEFLSVLTEKYEFQTTIDRIDSDEQDNFELIDYKTGKRVSEEFEMRQDPIVTAICAAAAQKWPHKKLKFSHLYLQSGRRVTIDIDQTTAERGRTLLEETAERIANKQFEPLGGTSCASCSAASLCKEERISLSMAKLQTMRECPKKYSYKYIECLPEAERERPALILSKLIKETLRDFCLMQKLISLEELQNLFERKLSAVTELSASSRIQLRESGNKALQIFHSSCGGTPPRFKHLDYRGRANFEGFMLNAVFDRVDILSNGMYEIVCYKTSKKTPGAAELSNDISGVFAWVTADGIWPQKVAQVTHHYLLTGDKTVFMPSERDIEKLKLAVEEFRELLFSGEFEGQRNPLCMSCEYADRCEDAKRMLLSPSKINAFLSCALKYKLQYIDRIPREPRPTPHLAYDRTLHAALREYHETCVGEKPSRSPFRGLIAKYWKSEAFTDWDEEQLFRARAVITLEEYFNSLNGSENAVMFDVPVRWTLDDVDISLRIDRVDELSDGKLEVIDYKTGKKMLDERVLADDMTIMNIFMAANQRWPGRVAKASFHYLAANKRISISPSEADIIKHRERIKSLIAEIAEGNFEPTKGALCNYCEFYGPCPEWKIKPYVTAGETPEQFRKRIRLSYSKMGLYENCPRSYGKLYVERIPPKPQPFFSFGTTIHETFEHIYDPAHPINKPTFEEVLQIFEKVRLKYREGYGSAEIEERYRQDGIRQLKMYYDRFIKNCEFRPAHAIEEYFEIPCGKYAVMTGFIDRIDRLSDGTYEILDYKTEPTMRTQQEVDEDKQLSIYYWACEDTMNLRISKLSLFMLDHDVKIETTRTRSDIAKVVEHVDEVAWRMLNEKEFKPKKNKYCKSCDHLHDCPLKEEILSDESLISMKKF